jgi:hypothetical protein
MNDRDRALLKDLLEQIFALDKANYDVVHAFERVVNEADHRIDLRQIDNSIAFLNCLGHVDAAQRELKKLVEGALGIEVRG